MFGAIVVALAGPAVLASASPAQADAGTLQVSSLTVQAGQLTPLTVTFTAPANPPSLNPAVTLTLPTGWTALSVSEQDLTCAPGACQLVSSSSTQVVATMHLKAATTFSLALQATPPAFASPGSFTAVEQYQAIAAVYLPPVTLSITSPLVTVDCPADGLGTLMVSPASAPAATNRNLTFAYTAGSCGAGNGGVVTVTVPPQWTPPSGGPGPSGLVTSTDTAQPSVSGSTITVPVGNLKAGTVLTFEYQMAQAPGSSVPYTFAAAQAAAGQQPQPLASSPTVTVTQVQETSPSPSHSVTPVISSSAAVPAGGAGTMTVTPAQVTPSRRSTLRFTYTAAQAGLAPAGEVTMQVPAEWTAPSRRPGQDGYISVSSGQLSLAGRRITVTGVRLGGGQQLIITYAAGTAPRAAGPATFLTQQRPDGTATLAALTRSPVVTVALASPPPPPASRLPVLLVVVGLVLVAGTAGPLAFRRLRRVGHGTAAGNVRAVPHTGPPPSLTVRYTGNRPALTVRIEPRVSATVTTIEERQP